MGLRQEVTPFHLSMLVSIGCIRTLRGNYRFLPRGVVLRCRRNSRKRFLLLPNPAPYAAALAVPDCSSSAARANRGSRSILLGGVSYSRIHHRYSVTRSTLTNCANSFTRGCSSRVKHQSRYTDSSSWRGRGRDTNVTKGVTERQRLLPQPRGRHRSVTDLLVAKSASARRGVTPAVRSRSPAGSAVGDRRGAPARTRSPVG